MNSNSMPNYRLVLRYNVLQPERRYKNHSHFNANFIMKALPPKKSIRTYNPQLYDISSNLPQEAPPKPLKSYRQSTYRRNPILEPGEEFNLSAKKKILKDPLASGRVGQSINPAYETTDWKQLIDIPVSSNKKHIENQRPSEAKGVLAYESAWKYREDVSVSVRIAFNAKSK